MIALRRDKCAGSWTAEKERKEGTLLGYTGHQNDIWAAQGFSIRKG
jgi:hypothetical protein